MRPPLAAVLLLFQAVISVHTELVTVPVTVTDGRGQRVSGLTADHFQVFEDGRRQPIAVFHRGDIPVTLGLIVDRSQSMRPKEAALRIAVSALLGPGRADDELFVVGFHDGVSLALGHRRPFTSDIREIATAVSATAPGGRTALYDGVAAGLEHLMLGHAERKALIVISDGGDNASRHTFERIRVQALRSGAVIYAIGLLGAPGARDDDNAGLLERLCRETGGVADFPRTTGDIEAASSRIATDLREQYTLGFVPSGRPDGRAFRAIRVTVTAAGRERLHVRTRAGYLAGDPREREWPEPGARR